MLNVYTTRREEEIRHRRLYTFARTHKERCESYSERSDIEEEEGNRYTLQAYKDVTAESSVRRSKGEEVWIMDLQDFIRSFASPSASDAQSERARERKRLCKVLSYKPITGSCREQLGGRCLRNWERKGPNDI